LIRKDVVIAVLATFCLTSTLFMITTSKSQSGVGEYNPWADYNGDGTIDIFDIVPVAVSFGATGDSTKNVTIAGHANKLAYSVRNVVIPATGWFTSDPILVDDYSKMTISLAFTEPEFDYWLWSWHSNSSFAFVADEFDETALGVVNCKTYDVVNMYIMVRVRNPGAFEGYLSLDVYLIP